MKRSRTAGLVVVWVCHVLDTTPSSSGSKMNTIPASQLGGVFCRVVGPVLQLPWQSGLETVRQNIRLQCTSTLESTWKGFQILSSQVLDTLISECDMETFSTCSPIPWMRATRPHQEHGPFSVFPLETMTPPDDAAIRHFMCSFAQQVEQNTVLDEVPRHLSTILVPKSRCERFLFHHYLNHVSSLMLPYDHPRNPWKWLFPAAAMSANLSEGRALYHSIIAHAAFHLCHLNERSQMLFDIGSQHYVLAIHNLLPTLGCESSSTSTALASILGLMYAQVSFTFTFRYPLVTSSDKHSNKSSGIPRLQSQLDTPL